MIFGSPPIVTSGLVLNLDAGNTKSYPRSGTVWRDLSGNNNSGSLTNGPTYNSQNGGSIVFDRVDDYITTTGMSNFSYVNGITVCIWNYNGGATGYYRGVVNNGTVADRIGGFDLRYGRENYFGGSDNGTSLYWRITNTAGAATGITLYANVNEWHYYIGTYDNTTLRVYKDGQIFNSVSHSAGGQLKTTTDSTTIGRSPGTFEYLDGRLASVSIYNRALTPTEVQQNYNALKSRFNLQ
jgi:hypothetical protein